MLHLNSISFDVEVPSRRVVVVDFWAPWCGPCRALSPVMEQVASEVGPDVAIAKLDIDECPELAKRFEVQSIPTVVFFKNGAEIRRFVGLMTKANILAVINSL
ncbi:MAG: thioredoxin [Puniceicoccales bacterium]|nr:thioredoxin [Puniceicoccales bacterium]